MGLVLSGAVRRKGRTVAARLEYASDTTLLRDVLYVLFKRKVVLIVLAIVGIVIVAYGASTVVPTYEASARVLVKRVPLGYQMPAESRAVLRRSEVVNSELQIIMSSAVAEAVVDRLGLATEDERPIAIYRLERMIRARALPESDIIDIAFRSRNPEMAALVVNTALDAYLHIRKGVAVNYDAVSWLDVQSTRLRVARDSVAMQIADFGGERGQLAFGRRGVQHMGLTDGFQGQLLELDTKIQARKQDLKRLEAWLTSGTSGSEAPTSEIYKMGTVMEAKVSLVRLATDLAGARARYAPDHPEIKRFEREISGLDELIRVEVQQAISRQRMELEGWEVEKRAVEATLSDLHTVDAVISEEQFYMRMLEHELSIRSNLYAIVMDRREQFKITAATDPNLLNIGIVSRAQVPARPIEQPINMRVVLGVFTILFGFMLVFGLEKTDHSLERREDVQRFLGLKVLASIPERRSRS